MNQHVTLKFPDMEKLLAFKKEVNVTVFEMNPRNFTLACHCTAEHINLAVTKYGAVLASPPGADAVD